MEDERDRENFKHVCKLCNKRYPSGKSLGGHMRSHVIAANNSNKFKYNKLPQKNKAPIFVVTDDDDDEDDDDDGIGIETADQEEIRDGHSGYGLRENPKKTWRVVDYNGLNNNNNNKVHHHQQQQQQNQQQQQQNHQQQNQQRICKQCGKGFQSLKALCGHMSSHSEKERNLRVEEDHSWSSENHSDDDDDDDDNPNNFESPSSSSKRLTRSSSMSKYSRKSPCSNNSEIDQLEQEEVAICLMMLSRDSSNSTHKPIFHFNLATAESSDNNSVILEGGSSSLLLSDPNLGTDNKKVNNNNVAQEMDNSDSGYFENGAKELESDDSNDGFFRNYYNKTRVDSGSGLLNSVSYDDYSSKKMKRSKLESFSNNNNNNSNKNTKPPQYSSAKTVVASSSATAKKAGIGSSKKAKGHKCPYCPKVFKSGQALGGHKRSHMMGGGGGAPVRVPPPEPEPKQPLIDLNLPAPMEDGSSHFEASW